MTVTDIGVPLVREGSGEDRAAYIQGLLDEAAFYETHPDVPLPGKDGRVHEVIEVPNGPGVSRGERVEALEVIAERLGVTVEHRDGMLIAARPFGPRELEAHLYADDYTDFILAARTAA